MESKLATIGKKIVVELMTMGCELPDDLTDWVVTKDGKPELVRNIKGDPIPEGEAIRGSAITAKLLRAELELWRSNSVLAPYAPTEIEEQVLIDKVKLILKGGPGSGFTTEADVTIPEGSHTAELKEIFKQLPIDPASAAKLLIVRQDIFDATVGRMAEQLYTGEISLGTWSEQMKAEIKALHTAAGAMGKRGWDNMTQSDWGKVGAEVKKQYRYLQGFAEDIAANRDTMTLGQLQARANMYAEAAGYTSERMQADADILDKLPWLPKDGSTQCLVNCKCHWELTVIGETKKNQLVRAVWMLSEAEHCDDCLDRDQYEIIIRVPLGVTVPDVIGGSGE